jgi:hypothetical protein
MEGSDFFGHPFEYAPNSARCDQSGPRSFGASRLPVDVEQLGNMDLSGFQFTTDPQNVFAPPQQPHPALFNMPQPQPHVNPTTQPQAAPRSTMYAQATPSNIHMLNTAAYADQEPPHQVQKPQETLPFFILPSLKHAVVYEPVNLPLKSPRVHFNIQPSPRLSMDDHTTKDAGSKSKPTPIQAKMSQPPPPSGGCLLLPR